MPSQHVISVTVDLAPSTGGSYEEHEFTQVQTILAAGHNVKEVHQTVSNDNNFAIVTFVLEEEPVL